MKLQFAFKHLHRSEALEEYTRHRLTEVSLFLLKQGQGQVTFGKTKDQFTIGVTVNSKEKFFKVQAQDADIYVAVDLAVGKLEKQFLRTRKVHQNHKKYELSKEGKMELLNSRLEFVGRFRKAA